MRITHLYLCETKTARAWGATSVVFVQNALLRLGGVFLSASGKFRLYSAFCALNFRLQKILANGLDPFTSQSSCCIKARRMEVSRSSVPEKSEELEKFLSGCNAEKQHSRTLESFLIKPVQRVLRYPLFLSQMKTLTGTATAEHAQISEALGKMEKVAEYINEMQRIYEEYGDTFAAIQSRNPVVAEKVEP